MSRYIDADALMKSLEAWAVNLGNPKMLVKEETEILIDSAPSIDIVRCEECKEYCDWLDGKICMRLGSYHGNTKPDDFCSYGERKDDDR